jgi:hypothetical protein
MNAIIINIILLAGLFTSNEPLFETHFIGMSKDEVSKVMIEKHRSYKLNTTTINNSFNYLKYIDGINEITVLFFLTDSDSCKAIRIMGDYSNINDMVFQLDENYEKIDNKNWEYKKENKEYQVTLEEGDWFFTVSIKEKE